MEKRFLPFDQGARRFPPDQTAPRIQLVPVPWLTLYAPQCGRLSVLHRPSLPAFSGRVLRTEKLLERQLSSSVPSSRRFVLSPLGKRKNASSIMPSLDYPTGGMCSRGIQLPAPSVRQHPCPPFSPLSSFFFLFSSSISPLRYPPYFFLAKLSARRVESSPFMIIQISISKFLRIFSFFSFLYLQPFRSNRT